MSKATSSQASTKSLTSNHFVSHMCHMSSVSLVLVPPTAAPPCLFNLLRVPTSRRLIWKRGKTTRKRVKLPSQASFEKKRTEMHEQYMEAKKLGT